MVRQVELPALVQVTLEAGFRRFARIDNGVMRAAGLIVNASGAVARLAPDVFGVVARRLQSRVCGGFEIAGNVFMALRARVRADECRSRDARWRHDRAMHRGTGNRDGGEERDNQARDQAPSMGSNPSQEFFVPRDFGFRAHRLLLAVSQYG